MMAPQNTHDDELPELPPLDDDGSLFEGDEPLLDDAEGDHDLDDSTAEGEPLDRFGAPEIVAEEGSLLDAADASDDLTIDEERELLAGAELGLLEDSDEGDGREISADEAGLAEDEGRDLDDGGAEGTGEDPSAALDGEHDGAQSNDAEEDEGLDDARFSDVAAAREEREPWPPRADAAWSIARASSEHALEGAESRTVDGELVVATRAGALIVSLDSGETFARVPGCGGVTAVTIVRASDDRVVLAALHDPLRDASAIALVRPFDQMAAELIADFFADESDDDVRVDAIEARALGVDGSSRIEAIVRGAFGALLLTQRVRG